MKNLKFISLALVCLLLISSCYSTKNFNNFYDKYEFSENSTSATVPLFLASLLASEDNELKRLLGKLDQVKILNINELDEEKNALIKSELNQALQMDDFTNWFSMDKENNAIRVVSKNRGKQMKNLVISRQGEESITIISAKTALTQKDVEKLVNFIADMD